MKADCRSHIPASDASSDAGRPDARPEGKDAPERDAVTGNRASPPAPYWTSPDGRITVYWARWEDIHAAGLVPPADLIHADPVYGNGDDTRPGHRGNRTRKTLTGSTYGKVRTYPPLQGNDRPFDPEPLLALARPLVTWGANHYASRLPDSPSWIVWDKRDGTVPDDGSDAELAWSNLGGALRTFRHAWRGLARASETGTPHLHPTQKPIALSSWVFQRAKLKAGDLVFVPYLGSGPDLPAAQAMGLRVIGCDVERWCCDTAIGRLGAITPERAAEPAGPLFTRAT